MPSTIVQKMTGAIIILIRATNIVPSTPTLLPTSGARMPTADADEHRDDDRDVEPVGAVPAAGRIRRFGCRWLTVENGHGFLQVDECDLQVGSTEDVSQVTL